MIFYRHSRTFSGIEPGKGFNRMLHRKEQMMRKLSFLAGLLVAAPLAVAQTSTWVPDKMHSEVGFTVVHMGISNVRGHFGNITGTIVANDADITKSTVNITIDTTTVDTGVSMRDNDLKSDHFFDVTQFPTATFVSTSVAKSAGGLTVTGNLTLHGVTKPVTLAVQGPIGPAQGMDKKPHQGFSGTTTISRTAFGVGANMPSGMVGDEIKLTIDLDLAKQ
jgi:polyisoprenoid-binding protein YceI